MKSQQQIPHESATIGTFLVVPRHGWFPFSHPAVTSYHSCVWAPKPSLGKPPRSFHDALDFFATTADPAGVLVNGLSFNTDAPPHTHACAALHLRHHASFLLPGPRALPSFPRD